MLRIGVFYDGNYFLHVSNYYNYDHQRRRRLSVSGLHEFIRHQVAQEENVDVRLCQIVSAHYFRGRLNAFEAKQRGDTLYWDRVFDDILMSAGVMTHFIPIRSTFGRREERGVDVNLALEAYDQAVHQKFDIMVLISSDGDYVPLIRKLNATGTRVMILSWDFEYENEIGKRMITRTSQELLEEVSYPIAMHEMIDNRLKRNDPLINNIFVQTEGKKAFQMTTETTTNGHEALEEFEEGEILVGEIFSLKNGYGFIKYPPNNLFFHHTSVVDGDFTELREGDEVEFTIGRNDEGEPIAENIRLLWEEE